MRLGGLTPLSATDFPGKLSAILFCQGCGWNCAYCHNPHLIAPGAGELGWEQARAFLDRRRGLLDAVVFSGGEPTSQSGLADAAREAREMGFLVGLHTAGPNPGRLSDALAFADWVGFDVKARWDAYPAVTGVPGSGESARESLRLLVASGVSFECRTTVHPDLISAEELRALSAELLGLGARRHVLQAFRSQGCANERLEVHPARVEEFMRAAAAADPRVELRGTP